MTPLVSILMPTYNAETYVADALRSVLSQTESRIEVIVVDDASTDGTVEVVRDLLHVQPDRRPQIHLLQNDTNSGPSVSRNRALDAATAPWVTLLDADDTYRPERIERLLAVAQEHDADLVADDVYFVPDDALVDLDRGIQIDARGYPRALDRLFATTRRPCVLTPETFVSGRLPGGSDPRLALVKPLFRRAFLERHGLRYQPHVSQGEDYVLYLDCLGAGARFVLADGPPLYGYRTHAAQISRQSPLAAQRERVAVNAELLRRPYVAGRPALRDLLHARHRDLLSDVATYALADALHAASLAERVRLVTSAPRTFRTYLSRRANDTFHRLVGHLRRLVRRLAQLLGLSPRESL